MGTDFCVDEAGARAKCVVHASIGDHQFDAVGAGEDVDGGAAGEEVLHHLPGHILRKGGDARFRRAVVAGADEDVRRAQFGRERLLDQAELQGQAFQTAEAALGLGLAVDLLLQRGAQGVVRRGDGESHRFPFRS